jgi:hypothetical protein
MHRLTAGTHNHHRVACSLAALALVVSGAVSQPQLYLTFVLPYHDARIALSNLCNSDAFRCSINHVLVTMSMSLVNRYEMQLQRVSWTKNIVATLSARKMHAEVASSSLIACRTFCYCSPSVLQSDDS